jgi:hypothetical protein
MDIVDSEPIAVGHPKIDGSQGQALDDGFQFGEKLEDIFFTAVFLILHPIADRTVVACHIVFHRAALLAFLMQNRATGMPTFDWQPGAGCYRCSKFESPGI